MVTAAISTATSKTRTGLARSSIVHPSPLLFRTTDARFGFKKSARQFVSFEQRAAALGQAEPRLTHVAAALISHQALANRILPDRQMRATTPPRFGVGVAAWRLRHPREELMRERRRCVVH